VLDDFPRLLLPPGPLPRKVIAPGFSLFKTREHARRPARPEMLKELRPTHPREPRREPRPRGFAAGLPRTQRGALAATTRRDDDAPARLERRRAQADAPAQRAFDFALDAHPTAASLQEGASDPKGRGPKEYVAPGVRC
jgi:hypothetical protein